jgi:membrane-associated phospholipid phosphatase
MSRDLGPLRIWSLGLLGTVISVTVSYLCLDRPISHLAHEVLQRFQLFEKLGLIPDAVGPLALIAVMVLALHGSSGTKLSRLQTVLLLSGISLALAVIVKDELKFAFGRTWPESWIGNNRSFIRDGVFGFFPFHGGNGYRSFPSGHTTITCAVLTVFWICYPKFRLLYALVIGAVAIGLVGANFHFLSDVIAGAFLGVSVGWISVALWEMGARRVRPDAKSAAAARFD